MSNVTAALPSKSLMEHERKLLKVSEEGLAQEEVGGGFALACLLDMAASWHGSSPPIVFRDLGQRWLFVGNAKNKSAARLLSDQFGLSDPDSRKAA